MTEAMQQINDLALEFWRTGDVGLARQAYTADVQRRDVSGGAPANGPEEVAAYVSQVREGFPDFALQITRSFMAGEEFVQCWTTTGTQRGSFLGIPASGRFVELHGVTVGRLRDGRIADEEVWFDQVSLLRQLGVLPPA